MKLLGKRITAIAAAGAMILPLCACSSNSSGSRDTYSTAYYSFTVNSTYTEKSQVDYGKDGIAEEYAFENGPFENLTVQGYEPKQLTAAADVDYHVEELKKFETITDIESEVITDTPYDCSAYHYTDTDTDKSDGQCFSNYIMNYQGIAFSVCVQYKSINKSKVRKEMENIVRSVEYISDKYLPDEPQDYDTPYFALHYEPKWCMARNDDTDLRNDLTVNVKFWYARTETVDKYVYPSLSVSVQNNGGTGSAAEAAEKECESVQDSKLTLEYDLTTEDFMGHEAHLLTRTAKFSDLNADIKKWYFDLNGMIYCVSAMTHSGSESDEQDIQELLSGLTLKELSEEEVTAQHQAREEARTTDETFRSASFIMDSRMERRKDSESENSVRFSAYYRDMEIDVRKNTLDAETQAKADADRQKERAEIDPTIEEADLDISISADTIGGYEMYLLSYIDPKDASHTYDEHHRIYYMKRDGEMWKFKFYNSPENEDEMTAFITQFFESLKFDE